MWLSASAYFYQYFRVYSPVAFPKKTDPNGDYVRRWVPELKNFPNQFIYEPWKAPKAAQERFGCVVGRDYPARIVVHEVASKANMALHAAAYAAAKGQGAIRLQPSVSGVGGYQVGSDSANAAPVAAARAAAATTDAAVATTTASPGKRSRPPAQAAAVTRAAESSMLTDQGEKRLKHA